jgi:DNA repair photolyase
MGRVHITELEAKGILTPQKSMSCGMSSRFTLNPYVGCAFGCSYCYVREMQYGDDATEKSEDWGNWVKVKVNAVALLRKSLRRLYGTSITIGSATDPYQPIERRLGLTRSLLELLVMAYPEHVHIQTRSPLVTRDIDVFRRFGNALTIGISLPTDNDNVRKVFEPSAPSIPQRIAAMTELTNAGIHTVASLAPLLPCNPENLGRILQESAVEYWVGGMQYHKSDPKMIARYRDHHWNGWRNVDRDLIREIIQATFYHDEITPFPIAQELVSA